jgi:hypothetical protein
MKRHPDNSILSLIFPRPRLTPGSELELAPCLQPLTSWLNGCRGFYGPVPRPLLMSFSPRTISGNSRDYIKEQLTVNALDVVHLRAALGLRANLLKCHVVRRLFGGLLDPPPRAFDLLWTT